MNLKQLQAECDQLVDQFNDEFVDLRRQLSAAVQAVAELWEPVVTEHGGTVSDLHGMIHCTDVRGMLLLHAVGFKNPDSVPPAGVLSMRFGQGMSAVLEDQQGTSIRVRKMPSNVIPAHGERLVARTEPAPVTPSEEDNGPDGAAWVLPFPVPDPDEGIPEGPVEWFVLYSFTPDSVQVAEVFLAAVIGIDSPSMVAIPASTPLPRQVRRRQIVAATDDDFGGFMNESHEADGPSPA